MARPRKQLGTGANERILELKRRGWSTEAIAKDLGTSERTVARRMVELRNDPEPAPEEEVEEALDALTVAEAEDLSAQLRSTITSLKNAATRAEQAKDIGPLVACSRAITQTTALLAKLTPPPAASIDERPMMVIAAKRGREMAHAFFDRLLGGPQG
jgi:hypothetical protein